MKKNMILSLASLLLFAVVQGIVAEDYVASQYFYNSNLAKIECPDVCAGHGKWNGQWTNASFEVNDYRSERRGYCGCE